MFVTKWDGHLASAGLSESSGVLDEFVSSAEDMRISPLLTTVSSRVARST